MEKYVTKSLNLVLLFTLSLLLLSNCYSKRVSEPSSEDKQPLNISKAIMCYDLLEEFYDVGIMGYSGELEPLSEVEKKQLRNWIKENAESFKSIPFQQALEQCREQ